MQLSQQTDSITWQVSDSMQRKRQLAKRQLWEPYAPIRLFSTYVHESPSTLLINDDIHLLKTHNPSSNPLQIGPAGS
jgi:hypothetical protein